MKNNTIFTLSLSVINALLCIPLPIITQKKSGVVLFGYNCLTDIFGIPIPVWFVSLTIIVGIITMALCIYNVITISNKSYITTLALCVSYSVYLLVISLTEGSAGLGVIVLNFSAILALYSALMYVPNGQETRSSK